MNATAVRKPTTAKPRKRKTAPPVPVAVPAEPTLLLRVFVQGKPISVNSMYTAGRGKNRYAGRRLTPEASTWLQYVWAAVVKHRPSRPLHTKNLQVRFEFYGLRANADVDNVVKLTVDGVADGLDVNDKHFQEVRAKKISGKDYPQGAMIEVWESRESVEAS